MEIHVIISLDQVIAFDNPTYEKSLIKPGLKWNYFILIMIIYEKNSNTILIKK